MNNNDIHSITTLFGKPIEEGDNSYSWEINKEHPSKIAYLKVYTDISMNDKDNTKSTLVSIISSNGYYELHNCTKVILFEPDEVIFLSKTNNRISSIIIRQTGNVSVFSNIDTSIMHHNIADLDPALVMAFTQLAIFGSGDEDEIQ